MTLFKRQFVDDCRRAGLALVAMLCVAAIPFCVVTVFPKQTRSEVPASAKEWPEHPKTGVCVPVEILAVHDGDTITCEVRMKVNVRLLDCWAAELSGDDKERGIEARDFLRRLAQNKRGVLLVPTGDNLSKSWTFGRCLGHVWLENDDKSLSQHMVESGFATVEKRGTK